MLKAEIEYGIVALGLTTEETAAIIRMQSA
jgi:hypothetical protein